MLILGKSEKKFSITSNLAIIVFCKTFYFILIGSFFWSDMFLWAYFWKGHPIYWWWTLRETSPCNLKKYLGLVSFWPPLKGCFWIFQEQGHRFYESSFFSISRFSILETVQQSFAAVFKIGVLKNFKIFIGKHLCWSHFLIQQPVLWAATLLKGDFNTFAFLWISENFKNNFLYRIPPLAASECIGKSLFTYELHIHKLRLKYRVQLLAWGLWISRTDVFLAINILKRWYGIWLKS